MIKKIFIGFILMFAICTSSMANGDDHNDHDHNDTINYNNITNIIESTDDVSMAMAGAVAHATNCEWDTYSLQGGFGMSNHKSKTAIALSLCQRYKDVLLTFSVTKQDGDDDEMVSVGGVKRF